MKTAHTKGECVYIFDDGMTLRLAATSYAYGPAQTSGIRLNTKMWAKIEWWRKDTEWFPVGARGWFVIEKEIMEKQAIPLSIWCNYADFLEDWIKHNNLKR